jgi:hypothetical protein
VEVLAQFVMPVWFVWALMEAYLQSKDAEGIAPQEENGKTLHPLTGLSR